MKCQTSVIDIYFEHISAENEYRGLHEAKKILDAGLPCNITKIFKSNSDEFPEGSQLIESEDKALWTNATFKWRDAKQSLDTSLLTFQVSATPHILVMGTGQDAIPVIQLSKTLGWKVSVMDHREYFLSQANTYSVDNAYHIKVSSQDITLPRGINAAIIMSHNIERDADYLQTALKNDVPYIGLLGPKKRKLKLLDIIGGVSKSEENRIHGPVGLNIGADLPETIALSILAEVQASIKAKLGEEFSRNYRTQKSKSGNIHKNAALILAAGSSKRMGECKQLIEYKGKSLLDISVEAAVKVGSAPILIITGKYDKEIRESLKGNPHRDSIKCIQNPQASEGMGSSIAFGVKKLMDYSANLDSTFILHSDHPYVTTELLNTHLKSLRKFPSGRMTISEYGEDFGPPALIPTKMFGQLTQLRGDKGAKSIIKHQYEQVIQVAFPKGTMDWDTKEDIRQDLSAEEYAK